MFCIQSWTFKEFLKCSFHLKFELSYAQKRAIFINTLYPHCVRLLTSLKIARKVKREDLLFVGKLLKKRGGAGWHVE